MAVDGAVAVAGSDVEGVGGSSCIDGVASAALRSRVPRGCATQLSRGIEIASLLYWNASWKEFLYYYILDSNKVRLNEVN